MTTRIRNDINILNPSRTTIQETDKEYFTAMVTVPLSPHIPEVTNFQLPHTSTAPKTGLDILINNNNTYEEFQGYVTPQPIGFLLPPPENYDDIDATIPNDLIQNENLVNIRSSNDKINEMVKNEYKSEDSSHFINDSNINQTIYNNIYGKNNINHLKDSYFICNTRKIIQQLTIHNANCNNLNTKNNVSLPLLNNTDDNTLNTDLISENFVNDGEQQFKSEKNIELTYDYPKKYTYNTYRSEQKVNLEPAFNNFNSQYTTNEATHTTTEINSTLLLFGRRDMGFKNKNKIHNFIRSHSAPVESQSNEPIYATVKKLPKKLKKLYIKNLENEIKYIPKTEIYDDKQTSENLEKSDIQIMHTFRSSEPTLFDELDKECESIHNENNISTINETNKNIINITPNIIPKSPLIRKKKRFSIHFKKKGNKKSIPNHDDSKTTCEIKLNIEEKPIDMKSTTERIVEQSSSVESQDMDSSIRFKENQTDVCKKHKCIKHNSNHIPNKSKCISNCECHKIHAGEKCLNKNKMKSSIKEGDLLKKRYSPTKHYLKHDSYQEMTTSYSERERTNSLSSSGHSGYSITNKSHKLSTKHRDGKIPWCGCWGNSCL